MLCRPSLASLLLALALALAPHASDAATILLTTFDASFDPGIGNQGWWSNDFGNVDSNDNYIVATNRRNFFTFTLSDVDETIVSATLILRRGNYSDDNETSETYELFDISTSPLALNQNDGFSPEIFADLGSGISYGAFTVAGSGPSHVDLSFALGASAIADLNAARGGFFSLGGTLTSAEGNDYLFGSTQQLAGRLVLVTVPEPSTALLMWATLIGLALRRRRGVSSSAAPVRASR